MQETIYETYTRTVCKICKNQKECQEELRKRIDNTMKCEKFKTTFKRRKISNVDYWQKW